MRDLDPTAFSQPPPTSRFLAMVQTRQSRRWRSTAGFVEKVRSRCPGRNSNVPGHSLSIDLEQNRLLRLLRLVQLGDRGLGAADRVVPDLLQDIARTQAVIVGGAARLDASDQ